MSIIKHEIRDVTGKDKKYARAYVLGTPRVIRPYKTEFYQSEGFVFASVWGVDKNGKTYQSNYTNKSGKVGYWVPTNGRGNHYEL